MTEDYGIYVHTPWCRSRCPYCAFNVVVSKKGDYRRWADSILDSWNATKRYFLGSAHSLYFGGGTPSMAPPSIIAELIAKLPISNKAEITVEVNPGSIDIAGLDKLRAVGVNRLSLGVQTFNSSHVKQLGRSHTVEQAHRLLMQVNKVGFRTWSFDLMFALPEQTLDDLNHDIDTLLDYAPPHVSLYGLTIEPGTAFATAQAAGKVKTPEAQLWRDMYDTIIKRLGDAGIERYEVSNFSKPGHRAIHNESVWRGGHYAGLGPGAHGYLPSGERTTTHRDLDIWFDDPHPKLESTTGIESAVDLVLSTLRHVDGLSRQRLQTATGFRVPEYTISTLSKHGLIAASRDYIKLTENGFPIADGVVKELTQSLEPIRVT
jgi:oxygen-independent coproporphyrinogen-3 oxidase